MDNRFITRVALLDCDEARGGPWENENGKRKLMKKKFVKKRK